MTASPIAAVEAEAAAGADRPRVRDFTLALDGRAGAPRLAHAARGHGLRSGTLRAPRRFDLVGLQMDAVPDGLDARVRTRKRGGRWSKWYELEAGAEHRGDDDRRRRATEPVWVGGADELQIRTARRARGLRAFFVDASGARRRVRGQPPRTAALSVLPPRAGIASAGAAPPIVPREQWAGDDCRPRARPEYGRVEAALIHHTVSVNSYSPDESAAIALGICRYHRNALKWSDIGYPMLIDKYGQIFEGRAGGVDRPVIGAHAQGFNSTTTGIATLGEFEGTALPPAGMRALAKLLAWKLPISGVSTHGYATIRSAGGSQSKFSAGEIVRMYRISAHRDVGRTTCPGTTLYGQLNELRRLVGRRGPAGRRRGTTSLSVTTSRRAPRYPARARLRGRLRRGGAPVPHAPVRIDYKDSKGRFRRLESTRTEADGTWSAAVESAFSRTMRAVYRGDALRRPARSRQIRVRVRARIAARTTTPRVPTGRAVIIRGRLRPIKDERLRVLVQRKLRSGRYTSSRAYPIRRMRGSGFAIRLPLSKPSLYRMRVRFDGDGRNLGTQAKLIYARVLHER